MTPPVESHAFGLGLDLEFEVPGLLPSPSDRPRVRLLPASPENIDAGWDAGRAEALARARRASGRLAMTVDRQGGEYRIWAEDHGLYRLSPTDGRLHCAPPAGVPAWRWQRVLLGNVLPLAAVLAGHEALHASAVDIEGRAVGFVARSGAGKTSLAMSLVRRGAGFVCDDVLALDTGPDGGLQAHPGPGLSNLRPEEARRPANAAFKVLGRDDDGMRVMLTRREHPLPLDRLYFVERGSRTGGAAAIEDVTDPGLVLGATFNLVVRTEERLIRQLELASLVAAGAGLHRLAIPAGVGPDETAAAVEAHVQEARA
jgi:hypothetical protein